MGPLCYLNSLRWWKRLPLKVALMAITVLVVCFPYPGQLVRHIQHWSDPNALIEPDAPALLPLYEELAPQLSPEQSPPEALRVVEQFVYKKLPYEWDWNTWGVSDYMPTVSEALEKGREDCDGRAVVAASLLAKLGFKAQIVADFAHVWVWTEQGQTMSPGKAAVVKVTKEHGVELEPGALRQLLRSIGYGVSVFPLKRELIILGVFWLLVLRSSIRIGSAIVCALLLLNGLMLMRLGSANYASPVFAAQVIGCLNLLAAAITQCFPRRITSATITDRPSTSPMS